MLSHLASLKLPSAARWNQTGITVAGAADGTNGSALNTLYGNYGIYWADNGILYIADGWNNRIILIAPYSTTAIAIVGGYSQYDVFRVPTDVFVTRSSIYVMDTGNFRVRKWSRDSFDQVTVAGITGVNGIPIDMTRLSNAHHLFVDNSDNVLVSDYGNHRVMRFPWNSTSGTIGNMVAGTGVKGSSPSQLNEPMGIFVTNDGTLYVADQSNHRIQKWLIGDSEGVTVTGTGSPGAGLSEFYWPVKVLVNLNGYMYIIDLGNHRIMRWALGASAGECIVGCSGYWGVRSDQLNKPTSMTFDSSGCLYVNDWLNNRVQKFQILIRTGVLLIDCFFFYYHSLIC